MRSLSLLSVFAIAAFTVTGIVACGSSSDDANVTIQDEGTTPQAKPNPCLSVKCPDATHCVAKGKTPSCVADPACTTAADCYLATLDCGSQCSCEAHEIAVRVGCTGTPSPSCTDPCAAYTVDCVNGACAKVFTTTP